MELHARKQGVQSVMTNNRSIKTHFWILATLYGLSFLASFLLSKTSIAYEIAGVWPKFEALSAHCSVTACVYDPPFVAMVYLSQVAICVLYSIFVLIYIYVVKKSQSKPPILLLGISALLAFVLYRMTMANLDFETPRYSLFENSVASSHLGMVRALWPSVLIVLIMLALWGGQNGRENVDIEKKVS
jgi:hypothetical protein